MAGALQVRGPAVFANLVVTPDAVDGLPSQPEPDPAARDQGFVRHWQIAPLQPFTSKHEPGYAEMPAASADWRAVDSERGGLLNLNRLFTSSPVPPSLVWLRYKVKSDQPGPRRVSLGWIGETWVYANGRLVSEGKNFYEPEGERRDPDGRMSLQNGSFDVPLKAGWNEIAIGLYTSIHDDIRTRTKYGWGIMMRFADSAGLSFTMPAAPGTWRAPTSLPRKTLQK